jgi:prepilin-type N-terminal cleavage/methylation domain-containing protein
MKKSFTLLELLISITLFSIIVVFLYKTIDQTKHSNNLFSNKEQALKESNHLHNIFLEDIAESSSITITNDKNKNSIIKIVTNNTYHNAFFNNITYLINSSKKLVRIESYQAFNELQPMTLDFEANSYMDVLLEDIELFELKNSGVNYNFLLKQKNKDRSFFNTYKLGKNL